jgi:hypothetical protein
MCEYCDIENWQKDNPYPPVPDPVWNVKFLDVRHAMSPTPDDVPQKRHYDRRYIDVKIIAANRFMAERLAWDRLQEEIDRVPFKDDFVLMGAAEAHDRTDEQGWMWAAWDEHTMQAKNGTGPCWHCGKETPWLEINFQAWLCSLACNRAKWAEYMKASRA